MSVSYCCDGSAPLSASIPNSFPPPLPQVLPSEAGPSAAPAPAAAAPAAAQPAAGAPLASQQQQQQQPQDQAKPGGGQSSSTLSIALGVAGASLAIILTFFDTCQLAKILPCFLKHAFQPLSTSAAHNNQCLIQRYVGGVVGIALLALAAGLVGWKRRRRRTSSKKVGSQAGEDGKGSDEDTSNGVELPILNGSGAG